MKYRHTCTAMQQMNTSKTTDIRIKLLNCVHWNILVMILYSFCKILPLEETGEGGIGALFLKTLCETIINSKYKIQYYERNISLKHG